LSLHVVEKDVTTGVASITCILMFSTFAAIDSTDENKETSDNIDEVEVTPAESSPCIVTASVYGITVDICCGEAVTFTAS
jgi:hypothetical protein